MFAFSFFVLPVQAAPSAPAGLVGNGTPLSCDETAFRNGVAAGSPVTFSCGGPKTIQLTSPEIISQTMVIDGGGVITLTGNLSTRLFTVTGSGSLSLENITLYEGYSGAAQGGAILNNGSLTLSHSAIKNSLTDGSHTGGAIAASGPVTIQNSKLSNNNASSGGALYALGGSARINIVDSTLTFNNALDGANGVGGAIDLGQQATLTVTGGSINSNMAPVSGGALYVDQNAAAVFQSQGADVPHISYNTAQLTGGAIASYNGHLKLLGADLEYNQTLTNTPSVGYGGAIDSEGRLTMVGSRLANNQGRFGGALFVGGSVTAATAGITATTFFANSAAAYGGGMYMNFDTTTVNLVDSDFEYNQAGAGGGLTRTNAHLNILRSSFSSNQAQYGGGLFLQGVPTPTVGSYVEIRDSTISSNLATSQHSGGIDDSALLDLRNVTIKDNHYGLYLENGSNGAAARLQSTLLDNSGGANCNGDGSLYTSGGNNLVGDFTCSLNGFNDKEGSDLALHMGPLTGSPQVITQFHLPLTNSPAINNGDPGCSPIDQRHALRNGACDIGAVEYHGLLPLIFFPMLQR